ncbi:hypothetical protein GCM10010172_47910 [Paractinoplanes ferrugineus]|uniref:Zinc ribbon domain-containing protein n=1 Tax=Paractinoplanes ferrugineus TaxID=113564 RepID=A0A919J054_9ACTN|nr:hypothetical protein [Actinoplanes ferrugineus]GIE11052.1 hypothetical protein Afe05nite_28920 [Actinoplanes ferrugineus]
MLCPLCGHGNDPSASHCVRCNAMLTTTAPPTQSYHAPPPRDRGGNRMLLVLLALGTVALLSLSAVVVYLVRGRPEKPAAAPTTLAVTTPPTTASPAPSKATAPRDQAAVIDSLLDRSVASRAKLNAAIEKVRGCAGASAALADMRTVGDERTKQIADVEAANLSGVDNGTAVKSTLKSALGFALAADQHFVSWAEPAATGNCADSPARGTAWERGQSASKQAQAAKKQFVAVWNPVAEQFGFDRRTTDKF